MRLTANNVAALVALFGALPLYAQAIKVDSETISGLGARNIGSAAMSGRVAAMDAVHEGNRLTIYLGTASGGVWKSLNGGTTYKPVFDKQNVQSIGADHEIGVAAFDHHADRAAVHRLANLEWWNIAFHIVHPAAHVRIDRQPVVADMNHAIAERG